MKRKEQENLDELQEEVVEETEEEVSDAEEENVEDVETEETDEETEEEETEEMTKSEARDYVEEEIDEKFLEDTKSEKMTPEKAQKKIKSLAKDIQDYTARAKTLEGIANTYKSGSLNALKTEYKNLINNLAAKDEIKDLKKATKALEEINSVEAKMLAYCREYNAKMQGITDAKNEIEDLKNQGYQCSLFDESEEVKEEAVQNNLAEEPTCV